MLDTPSANKGFTLLGLLVATGIVLIVMVGVVGLTVRVMRAGTDAKNNFIATALAREGIELVRSLRDDNYLNYRPSVDSDASTIIYWRGDPNPQGQDGVLDDELVRAAICNGQWIIDPVRDSFSVAPMLEELTDPNNARLFFDSTSTMYVHDAVGNENTPFSRVITISSGQDCGMFSDAFGNKPSPFTVTSTVGWETEDGVTRQVILTQELYAILRYR